MGSDTPRPDAKLDMSEKLAFRPLEVGEGGEEDEGDDGGFDEAQYQEVHSLRRPEWPVASGQWPEPKCPVASGQWRVLTALLDCIRETVYNSTEFRRFV